MKATAKLLCVLTFIATAFFVAFSGSGAMDKKAANPVVILGTSMGHITIELLRDRAPKTVANFLEYVNSGFYKDTIFHRVIKGFMIQGGGLTAGLEQKPTRPPVENEAANGEKNMRGAVAMARTSEIHSATAQFFINTVHNPFLDHRSNSPEGFGYCVFGRVTGGMEVVDKIESSATRNDVPIQPVIIKDVRLKD
jgi:peptidyl-prolyl cis-trans isomerase B (cyclophilin B)